MLVENEIVDAPVYTHIHTVHTLQACNGVVLFSVLKIIFIPYIQYIPYTYIYIYFIYTRTYMRKQRS